MAPTRHNGRPPVACEITATHVIAGRTNSAHDALELVDTRTLGDNTLTPGLVADNVHDAATLQQAIRDTLSAVGARSGREVVVVVPDAAVRIVLLDFDTLPERKSESDAIVRFRLKKSLPFDVDKASLSYDVQRAVGSVRVVAAVTLSSVLAEYESAVREAGFIPGVVLPSTVAALGAVDGSRPTMILKVDRGTTSVAMVDKNELLLFRTLESGSAETNGERLAEDVYPSIVFFQDTYGVNVERLLVAGSTPTAQIAPALESQTGMRVQELVSSVMLPASATGSGRSQLAGVVGALLG
jgi:type IV pilus assembly protein PilM